MPRPKKGKPKHTSSGVIYKTTVNSKTEMHEWVEHRLGGSDQRPQKRRAKNGARYDYYEIHTGYTVKVLFVFHLKGGKYCCAEGFKT